MTRSHDGTESRRHTVLRRNLRVSALAVLLTATVLGGCGSPPQSADEEVIVWKPLAAWSGRGVQQTDAFMSDTGLLRIVWEARAAADPPTSEAATLRVSVHSAVSGRLLVRAVERQGPGRDTAYVAEDPRAFYLVIESANLEWNVEVAEGIPARRRSADSR